MTIAGAQMNKQGRVVVPAAIRRDMGIEGPADLIFRFDNDVLTVETLDMVVEDVQRIATKYIPSGRSLVDELIAQRRAEAASE
ncbi:MAG: AbrB/MazE/SpoVT family DNA-binding domain-containing protein [Acidimicrobiia bacterium]